MSLATKTDVPQTKPLVSTDRLLLLSAAVCICWSLGALLGTPGVFLGLGIVSLVAWAVEAVVIALRRKE